MRLEMQRLPIWIFLALLTISISSCESIDKQKLIGEWMGAAVIEEGNKLSVDPKEISFYFKKNESYQYNSTLNYREAGSYYVESNYLFTTDTVNQASTEKAVEIILLSEDSLHLRMEEKGKERILKLVKQ
ncbi:MAG: hypothetical protein MRY78_10270 [Saprospiraceae bacterium]|nr:hypothetical protein [Saprospiraceae bacterium]